MCLFLSLQVEEALEAVKNATNEQDLANRFKEFGKEMVKLNYVAARRQQVGRRGIRGPKAGVSAGLSSGPAASLAIKSAMPWDAGIIKAAVGPVLIGPWPRGTVWPLHRSRGSQATCVTGRNPLASHTPFFVSILGSSSQWNKNTKLWPVFGRHRHFLRPGPVDSTRHRHTGCAGCGAEFCG